MRLVLTAAASIRGGHDGVGNATDVEVVEDVARVTPMMDGEDVARFQDGVPR